MTWNIQNKMANSSTGCNGTSGSQDHQFVDGDGVMETSTEPWRPPKLL